MRGSRTAIALAGITGAASAAVLALAAPVQAATYEWNTATAGSPPSGMRCVSMTGAEACFEKNGDRWWVRDTASDSHSATASWENDLFDGIQWRLYRQGSCVNKLGYGRWGACNKDYYESGSTNELGGKGSQLDWQACVYDSADGSWHGCSTDIAWVDNNA
jgi:hypothetical protein